MTILFVDIAIPVEKQSFYNCFCCCCSSSELKLWLDDEENFELVKEVFDSTSRWANIDIALFKKLKLS
mgnify:CR=1 FL=1